MKTEDIQETFDRLAEAVKAAQSLLSAIEPKTMSWEEQIERKNRMEDDIARAMETNRFFTVGNFVIINPSRWGPPN